MSSVRTETIGPRVVVSVPARSVFDLAEKSPHAQGQPARREPGSRRCSSVGPIGGPPWREGSRTGLAVSVGVKRPIWISRAAATSAPADTFV